MSKLAHFIQLERAAFKAWPAAEQIDTQNAVICFADGYTKRANSANILQIQQQEYEKLVSDVEVFYRHKQQPSIFRLPSFCDLDSRFDQYLDQQGYYFHHQSLVLEKSFASIECETAKENLADLGIKFEIKNIDNIEQWLECFNVLQQNQYANQENVRNPHLSILKRIKDKLLPAILTKNGQPVACALGVVNQNNIGIFDVITASELRGKGLAKSLLTHMLDSAAEQGANNSYLQVMSENIVARHLYEKMGFIESYQYWYRVKEW